MTMSTSLSAAERDALQSFARRYGRGWKNALRHKWLKDNCHLEPDGNTLRALRDTRGAAWLSTFVLEPPPCHHQQTQAS